MLAPLSIPVLPSVGRAQTSGVELAMDCPALQEDGLAALEARARAELATVSLPAGRLTIRCSATSGNITWKPADGAARDRAVALGSEAAVSIDALLDGLHGLILEEPPKAALPSPPPPPLAPDAPTTTIANPDLSYQSKRHTFAATLGADSELWSGAIGLAVGGHAGARIAFSDAWSAVVLAGPEWGVDSADGIRAWTLRIESRVDYTPIPAFQVGVGLAARVLWVDATTSGSTSGTTGGALASVRYVLPLGAFELSLGPTIEVLVRPVVVESAGSEVFHVPSLLAGLSLDVSTR
jgi:hypothetical protein